MTERIATYAGFWPHYLREHARPLTRAVHYVGTGVAIALVALAIVLGDWWPLPAASVCGYAFAWAGHAFIERNRPGTFTHPVWSLYSDFRMFFLALTGGLGRELRGAGVGGPK